MTFRPGLRCQAESSYLCVPKTSSKSCDQAIFADQATDASVSSDAVPLKIDRFGQPFQWRSAVQGAVGPVLVVSLVRSYLGEEARSCN